jgi:acyl carrier protein
MTGTIAETVTRLVAEHLGAAATAVTPDTELRDDLGADSLDSFELLMALEDEFSIDIPDEDAGTMRCVNDVVAYVEARTTRASD